MRKELGQQNGQRDTFCGTVKRFGTKSGWQGKIEKTILLIDIRTPEGEQICDHLWFNLTKGFSVLDLSPGDQVQFDARVAKYEKGYKGWRTNVYAPIQTDYKLSFPTKMRKLAPCHRNNNLRPNTTKEKGINQR